MMIDGIPMMQIHPCDLQRVRKFGLPEFVPMYLLNETRALMNHSQSLFTLSERGGLSVMELLANLDNIPLKEVLRRYTMDHDNDVRELGKIIISFKRDQRLKSLLNER